MPFQSGLSVGDLETAILETSRGAVDVLVNRLVGCWPEYQSRALERSRTSIAFDVVETVLQFEIACQLQTTLSGIAYVTWEQRYSTTYSALVDIVICSSQHEQMGDDRTAIELKWISEAKGGLDGLASDSLKLGWAAAKNRYVLGVGPRDTSMIEKDLNYAIQRRVRWPGEESDLEVARENFDGCRLVGTRTTGSVIVALFCAPHRAMLK